MISGAQSSARQTIRGQHESFRMGFNQKGFRCRIAEHLQFWATIDSVHIQLGYGESI